jgi:hypothetical protein
VQTILKSGDETGCGTGLDERRANGVANKVVHEAWLAEADLCLGWVDIDVDLLRRHLEVKEDDGIRSGREDVPVSLRKCMEDELIADETLIDENVNGVAIELLQLGLGDEASQAQVTGVGCNVILFALPWWGLGKAGASEVKFGGSGEHVVAGVFAEDLEE